MPIGLAICDSLTSPTEIACKLRRETEQGKYHSLVPNQLKRHLGGSISIVWDVPMEE